MELTQSNYHCYSANNHYLSSSQFKNFLRCEKAALAEIKGLYAKEVTTALLQGLFVDAAIEGALNEFIVSHPEIVSSTGKTAGQLKAEYRDLEDVVERIYRDQLMKEFLTGQKQVILTGEIAEVDFKSKIDVLHDDKIVDFKLVRDLNPIWDEEEKHKVSFIEYWGYLYQGAIYQELERQRTGKVKPFYLAVATKEKVTDIEIIRIPDSYLAEALEEIADKAPVFASLKRGLDLFQPTRCGKCDYCKMTKKLEEPIEFMRTV